MIIMPSRKLVILLPWKTASQTLRARLGHLNQSGRGGFFHFNPHLRAVVHQHLTLGQYLGLPEARLGYRVAVFVRNPYDRVVSGFLQIVRDIRTQPASRFPEEWIKALAMRQLDEQRRAIVQAGGSLDLWFRDLPEDIVRCGGRNSSLPLHPCHYWTHSGDQCVADFIGKVEAFEADFDRLCSAYDLEPGNNASKNVSKEIARDKGPGGYDHASKLAPATIARINALFQDDFRLFGYRPL